MKTVQAVRRAQVIALAAGDGLPDMLGRLSDELNAQLHVVPDGEALCGLLDPGGNGDRAGALDGEAPMVAVLDDHGGAEPTEALLGKVLRVRPTLKVVYVSDRLEPVREIELRLKGVYFLIVRPVEESLLRRVLAKAIEHETTRWKRVGR